MEIKSFPVADVKEAKSKGEFEALVSVFGNVDSVGDRVVEGAFSHAIKSQDPPPVYYSHGWHTNQPPIGETLDWWETSDGLHVRARLFVGDDDESDLAKAVYTAMKSHDGRPPALRKFSFAYDVAEDAMITEDKQQIRELKALHPIHEIGPCAIPANDATEMLAAAKNITYTTASAPTSNYYVVAGDGQGVWKSARYTWENTVTPANWETIWTPEKLREYLGIPPLKEADVEDVAIINNEQEKTRSRRVVAPPWRATPTGGTE